jgi:exonuclease VII small subunit
VIYGVYYICVKRVLDEARYVVAYNGFMSDIDDAYLPPTYLSRTLRLPLRTIVRWAREGRVRTRPSPTRQRAKLYHRGDVERLAISHVAPPLEPPTPAPTAELVPLSDMLAQLNRKDDQLAEANAQLQRAAVEIGRLQERVDQQQKLLESAQKAQDDLSRVPWWVRIVFLRGQ